MAFDTDRIDEAVLALLYLGLHDDSRAWKGFDWDAMNRLQRPHQPPTAPRRPHQPPTQTQMAASSRSAAQAARAGRSADRRSDRRGPEPN